MCAMRLIAGREIKNFLNATELLLTANEYRKVQKVCSSIRQHVIRNRLPRSAVILKKKSPLKAHFASGQAQAALVSMSKL